MSDVYKLARDLATAKRWHSDGDKSQVHNNEGKFKGRRKSQKADESESTDTMQKAKDDSLESWGTAKSKECYLYIKAGRCIRLREKRLERPRPSLPEEQRQ